MRQRIIVCLSIILLLCLVGNVIAVLCLESSTRSLSLLADSHRVQAMRADLVSSAVRVEADLLAFRAGDPHHPELRVGNTDRLRNALHQCTECHHRAEIRIKLDTLQETFEAYAGSADPLFDADVLVGSESEVQAAQRRVDRLVVLATELSDLARSHLTIRSSEAMRGVGLAWKVLVATMIVALAAGIAVAIHLKRRLTQPVAAMLAGIEKVRHGDLDHTIPVGGDEEFQKLADAFNDANASLRVAREGVLQAERMAAVGKLAAGVAHEVGNPLASISSIVQLMQRGANTESNAKKLQIMMDEIARISRIVRDLLIFSKPAAAKKREPVDVVALVQRAITLLSYDRRSKNLQTTLHHDVSVRHISADEDRLMLVFTNIIINAYDAIASDPPSDAEGALQISCRQDGDETELRFEDNGPGMTSEEMAQAFEPFFTTKPPGSGTGLGLWVCYQVVKSHSGRITVQSEPGKGVRIVIRLPRDPAATEETLQAREPEPLPVGE